MNVNDSCTILSGASGQDGQELSHHLISLGLDVIGINRRSSQPRDYLNSLKEKGVKYVEGDITDYSSMSKIIKEYKPKYFYHLGGQSHVMTSFQEPLHTMDATGKATLNLMEIIKNESPETRFYNAASSEMFGSMYSMRHRVGLDGVDVQHYNIQETPVWDAACCESFDEMMERSSYSKENIDTPYQDEITPLRPQSVYGISKLFGFHTTRLYRESFGLFASSGILHNHDGVYRSITFVTRKITNYVSRLRLAKELKKPLEKLKLGNINTYRDFSDSFDMVRGMVLILNHTKPDDFVLGSGEAHSIREFAQEAFSLIGEDYQNHIEIDQSLFRPGEVYYLRANPSKAKNVLGWKSTISFNELVKKMVDNDVKRTNTKNAVYGDI